MSKPSADTKWSLTGTKTEPTSGQKDAGWSVGQKPPAQWLNWWMDAVDQWKVWLAAFESTAHTWSAAQTFSGGIAGNTSFVNDVTVNGAFTTVGAAAFDAAVNIVGAVHLLSTLLVNGVLTTTSSATVGTQLTVGTNIVCNNDLFLNGHAETVGIVDTGNISTTGNVTTTTGLIEGQQIVSTGTNNSLPSVTAITASLVNSWATFSGDTPKFYPDSEGRVWLIGRLGTGTNNTVAFNCPYHPQTQQFLHGADSAGVHIYIKVDTNGNVTPTDAYTSWISIDGLSFRTT